MKVLFITSTRLGDAILSTGLLDYLLREYPEAKVTVACGPLPQTIFEGFPNVERIIALKKEKNHGHWIKLWQQTVGTKWDKVIDLRDSAVSRLIWADKKYIFGKHIDKTKHKVEQAAEVMGLSEVPSPALYFTQAQKKFAEKLIPDGGPVIGVGPSANWIGKTWPAENFIELVAWLTSADGKFPNARVVVFAAPGEEGQAQPVLDSVSKERQIDGIAKGNPGEVAAALSRCDFYIGNDSGLMHAAAAAGVPTVGLFGPSYPHLYSPWGAHTVYAQTPETFDELIDFEGYSAKTLDHSLMVSLSVDVVKAKIR
jgi:lipopolysaccharide export system permease protein